MLSSSFGRASTSGYFWADINSYPFTSRLLYWPDQILAFFVKPVLSFIIQSRQTSSSVQARLIFKAFQSCQKCLAIKNSNDLPKVLYDKDFWCYFFGFSCSFCLSDNSNTIKIDSIQALSKYAINIRLNESCIDQSSSVLAF